tara:strand:+ start:210 stop:383 length:174 start_codon:yes stop_codon:yes gene_type:complete
MTETSRAKKLVKIFERLIKQDHLYDEERIREMKKQLGLIKDQIAEIEKQTYKGFGKK